MVMQGAESRDFVEVAAARTCVSGVRGFMLPIDRCTPELVLTSPPHVAVQLATCTPLDTRAPHCLKPAQAPQNSLRERNVKPHRSPKP